MSGFASRTPFGSRETPAERLRRGDGSCRSFRVGETIPNGVFRQSLSVGDDKSHKTIRWWVLNRNCYVVKLIVIKVVVE